MAKHKKAYEKYSKRHAEYQTYLINPIIDGIGLEMKDEAANRLHEAIQEAENEDDSDSESDNDGDDNQSVMTCDTELLEMRETVAKRSNRR